MNRPVRQVQVRTSLSPVGRAKAPVRLVVVVRESVVIRRRVASLALQPHSRVTIVAEADHLAESVPLLERVPCDVLLTALDGGLDGALTALRLVVKRVPVVVVSTGQDPAGEMAALRLGVRALLSSDCADDTIIRAIHAVAEGRVWLRPHLQGDLVNTSHQPALDALTPRECEIIRQVALARRNREVAGALHISADTVKKHLSTIFQKLSVRTRVELVLRAIHLGIMSSHEPLHWL